MNKASIKTYAIWARNELISRVSQQAYEYGVEKDNIVSSDADNINGRLLSEDEKNKRRVLISQVNQKGYDLVMEEVAYTWFNRFIALRFMEVNNYLPNKVRLFTNENNEFKPQILDEALHIELLGLDKNKVISLKEANDNEELYKELLLATCNNMSRYLPGMFKPIDEYMTLLFPSNLLREESVLGRLISDIDEDSWNDQVQIIGWLYQYYNTEPKDKVYARKSGTKIKKEEIPAVTQLFTPDWIVRYMTENSLGRLWLDGHPNTDIKSNWKYYLDEAEQEESVQVELNKIKAEHAKLKPEDIKFLDPCMGSGHILVYAFDVFMQIYVSEGWTEREAAKSILQNNLYGLDIDERAYQLSYFALMMKARQYYRRILSEGIVPNVMAIEESNTFNKDLLIRFGNLKTLAERVINIFIDAKEYGSILNVEFTEEEITSLENKLNEIYERSSYGSLVDQLESDQLYYEFYPLLKQARIMSQKYECVVTNPPYMSSSGMNVRLLSYINKYYSDAKYDLCTVFILTCRKMLKQYGYQGMITMQSWMFIGSYERLREYLLKITTITSLLHLGIKAFDEIGNDVVQTVAFTLVNLYVDKYQGQYFRLLTHDRRQKEIHYLHREKLFYVQQKQFSLIPGSPVSYWVPKTIGRIFSEAKQIKELGSTSKGIITGDNNKFLRLWYELKNTSINYLATKVEDSFSDIYKWYPCNKGGNFRKWFGNNDYVINWQDNGQEIMQRGRKKERNCQDYADCLKFSKCITWTSLASTKTSFRISDNSLSESAGMSLFLNSDILYIIAFLNSCIAKFILNVLNPTLNYTAGSIGAIPIIFGEDSNEIDKISNLSRDCIYISKEDWDSFETSWGFKTHPFIRIENTNRFQKGAYHVAYAACLYNEWPEPCCPIEACYFLWKNECKARFNQLKANEEELNRNFIDIYGLQDELTPEVDDKDVTVRKADLQREIKSFISYAVGCMFGRYSLDIEGLAYAGGEWDDSKYKSFIPDKDNIVPICDEEYFEDDIVGRFIEFIKVAYGKETLEENLQFIADTLGGKGTSREIVRNYFLNDFFKDHCNTYQVTGSGKRPIYWQFDSGKKNGFKALIYIHRYTPDLIARMRTSYVHEQQSRYENQISMVQNRVDTAGSTSERVKAEKELKKLKEQAEELRLYEEKIHHWADKMEQMDLDDGVKANYAKFQELLAKIK